MSESTRDAVNHELCVELKLPTIRREYRATAGQVRDANQMFEDFLHQLLDAEVIERRRRCVERRIRGARFPDPKTLDELDFTTSDGLPKQKVL